MSGSAASVDDRGGIGTAPNVCVWTVNGGDIMPGCGSEDGLIIHMKAWTANAYYQISFCPFCGKDVEIVEAG